MELSGHDAIDKFTVALNEAAWDLGVAGGWTDSPVTHRRHRFTHWLF
jgi:hypothetical protein